MSLIEKFEITNIKQGEQKPDENKIYQELVEKKLPEKPKMENFYEVYPQKEISRDIARVERIEDQFEVSSTRKSKILEALLLRQIELAEWFGNQCQTIETTKYDDYVNHTDFIAEWEDENGDPVRLAIDVTSSEENLDYGIKAENILRDLNNYQGTKIKYFISEQFGYKGAVKDIPRVIIAIRKEVIDKLYALIMPTIDGTKGEKRLEGHNKLCKCFLQASIVEEMIKQLDKQSEHLEKHDGKNTLIYQNIQKAIKILETVFDKKIGSVEDGPSSRALKVAEISAFFS